MWQADVSGVVARPRIGDPFFVHFTSTHPSKDRALRCVALDVEQE
jgi:hypothetical protein